jgi:hypothetical protein
VTTNCLYTTTAVEKPSVVVTRSIPTLYVITQSLERKYLEASEGAEGLVDHQVHFSVSQLETGDTHACKGEPELHELQLRLSKLNFCTKSKYMSQTSLPPSA